MGLKTLQNHAYVLDEWLINYLTFLNIKLWKMLEYFVVPPGGLNWQKFDHFFGFAFLRAEGGLEV